MSIHVIRKPSVQTVQPAIQSIFAGTTRATTGEVVFSNLNGISFGMNAGSITASYTVPAGGASPNFSAGTTSSNLDSVVFSNSGGVSFGLNGSTITATVATNYQAVGAYLTTAMLSNAATISNIRFSAGTTSNLLSAVTFADSNGVSFGLNAGTVTGTVATNYQSAGAYLTTAALSNHSHGNPTLALTNLTGTTASASNGFTLSLSAAAPGAGGGNNIAAGTRTAGAGTVLFDTGNGITFGLNAVGGTVLTASHNAITTGALSDHSHGNPTLALTNLSGTTASASNGFTLSLAAAAPGGAGAARSYFNWPEVMANSSAVQVSGSSKYLQPIEIPHDLSVSYARFPCTFSCIGSMASIATAAAQTIGVTVSSTFQLAFYTLGTGANSRSLQSYFTTSTNWIQQATIQAAATGSHWSSGQTISFPGEQGQATATTISGATTLTNRTLSSGPLANFTNVLFLNIPMATSFSAGMYWMAFNSSTNAATSVSTQISTVRILASNFAISQLAQSINLMGSATNSSNLFPIGQGDWSTNSIGATTGSIQLAAISRRASNPILYFDMIRQA